LEEALAYAEALLAQADSPSLPGSRP
jgi:hypothetical protein